MEIAVASHNRGKLAEMRKIAGAWPVRLAGPEDLGITLDFEETGSSFDENAMIKARALHRLSGGWVIADDSGLVVDALGGAPGICSARYAGHAATDRDNYELLLSRLLEIPQDKRQAHFHCSLAFISPEGRSGFYHGLTRGMIALQASGRAGFGYDPVFIPLGGRRTMAELAADEKDAISHRGQALRQFLSREFPRMSGQERDA